MICYIENMINRSLKILGALLAIWLILPMASNGIEILDADPKLTTLFFGRPKTDEHFGSQHFSSPSSYSHLLGSTYYQYSMEALMVFGFKITEPFLHEWKKQGSAQFMFSIIKFHEGDARNICPIHISQLASAKSSAEAAAARPVEELGVLSRDDLEENRLYSFQLDFQDQWKPNDIIWIGLDGAAPIDRENHNLVIAGDLSSYPGGSSPMLIAGNLESANRTVHGISLLQSLTRLFCAPRVAEKNVAKTPSIPQWINPFQTAKKIETLKLFRTALKQELSKVPAVPIRTPDRHKGFHSTIKPTDKGWELRFLLTRRTTSITLYPALMQNGTRTKVYAFPKRFTITAFPRDGSAPVNVADWSQTDFPLPGMSPVIFPIAWKNYSEVRLRVIKGVPVENGHTFALSEVSFPRCHSTWPIISLASAESMEAPPYWSTLYLTDGRTAFGSPFPAADNPSKGTFRAEPGSSGPIQIIIREEIPTLWDGFEFHPTQHPSGLPPADVPTGVKIEFSNYDDFSVIHQTERTQEAISLADGKFPFVMRFPSVAARCARITLEPTPDTQPIQLEEITFNGGLPLLMPEWFRQKRTIFGTRGTAALYDRIINGETWDPPIRRSTTLIRRDVLIGELQQVENTMLAIQRSHQNTLAGLKASAIMLRATLIGLLILLQRKQARQAQMRIRHRIQQDLHDEIGSQLSTISMITNFNKNAKGITQELRTELADANQCAREAIASLAEVIWLTDKEILTLDQCFDVMRKRAEKMVHTMKLELDFPQNIPPLKLSFRTKRNLILLFTEALNNGLKHSNADTIRVLVRINSHRQLILNVSDNGHGFQSDAVDAGIGLESMRDRALKLGGTLDITSSKQQGTTVQFIGKI